MSPLCCIYVSGMQGMIGADMYGMSPSSYAPMGALRSSGHSQPMLIPGHPHYGMMMAHAGAHLGHHPGMYGLPTAQSPPLHPGMHDGGGGMNHIQDIHAG